MNNICCELIFFPRKNTSFYRINMEFFFLDSVLIKRRGNKTPKKLKLFCITKSKGASKFFAPAKNIEVYSFFQPHIKKITHGWREKKMTMVRCLDQGDDYECCICSHVFLELSFLRIFADTMVISNTAPTL